MALPPRMSLFSEFIYARENVRVAREAGEPQPWTKDPILHRYRFCNINREHDRVTIGIRKLYEATPPQWLWFNLIVARLFNHLPTLHAIGPITQRAYWENHIMAATQTMRELGQRVFNPAYIVSTNGRAMDKVDYLIEVVLTPISHWLGSTTQPAPRFTHCAEWCEFLLQFQGLGDFMVNQIITDYKYTVLLPRHDTPDWTTFVMAGPGTKRGLNWLHGRPPHTAMTRVRSYDELIEVRKLLKAQRHDLCPYFADLNNLANAFCEWSKWMKAKTNTGKPKQKFTPYAGDA